MRTTKYALPISAGLLFLVLTPVLQADTIPISGTIAASNSAVFAAPPNIFNGTSTGTGLDSTFGAFTFSAAYIGPVDPTSFTITGGTFLETLAGGTLSGTLTGSGTIDPITKTTTFTEILVITGGTGSFVGDTGQLTLTGTGVSGVTNTPSTGSYVGMVTTPVTTPEPSTLLLLSASLLGLMGLGARKKRLT